MTDHLAAHFSGPLCGITLAVVIAAVWTMFRYWRRER